ncbi:sel1 repeat family protein [Catenovulum sp. SM1970]|uniref:tetratricopeptide repeat protein n=1 Tax=Marinifaba aquimaris TaxID=2741323 RepID=UPI001571A25C|nr:tetratricopeptide repeat protein [Marinifaba aquimaris]NTS77778.1 sel1 repeat family protein [Marinifaba aquimaris]
MFRKNLKPLFLSLSLFSACSFANLEKGIELANFGEFQAAKKEFESLIEQNYAPGMYHLAELYAKGLGMPRDQKKALALYQQAADMQMPEAIFMLGSIYEFGKGVKPDLKKAFDYYELAAKKNVTAAHFNLGVMYATGQGVSQNYQKSLEHYHLAAADNLSAAQFNIALMYYEGKGVKENIEMSYVWNMVAAYNGHLDADKSRKLDQYKMSEAQVKAAKKQADGIYQQIIDGKYVPPVRFK